MSLFAVIPLLVLICSALGSLVYFGVVLARTVVSERKLPTARGGLSGPAPASGWPAVCVIVPAHNEEAVIEGCAKGLVSQDYPNLRVVFALDRCTDQTEAIVRRVIAGAPAAAPSNATRAARSYEVLHVEPPPDGWAGKTNAVWRGVTASTGARGAEFLLFADADTAFEPGLVRSTVWMALDRGLDLLSLLSELTCDRWFEKLVQPAAGFELVRQYPLDLVNRAERPRAFANGQFMLFRRGIYDTIGGHELVKAELLEDIAFARYLDRVKGHIPSRWGVFMASGMLRCRMYRSWDSFRRGWKRIYTEASLRRPAQLSEWAWRKRLTGVVFPLSAWACLAAGPMVLWLARDVPMGSALVGVGAASVLVTFGALAKIYRSQGLAWYWALTYPMGAWSVSGLLSEAARDLREGRRTVWGGREYVREAGV